MPAEHQKAFIAFCLILSQLDRVGQKPKKAQKEEDMKRCTIALSALLLAGCFQSEADRLPAVKNGTVTGYSEDLAIITDSFGQKHSIDVSDAVIGDEYTIRCGIITEKTYEGCQDGNADYYIVKLENGDLHEVEADDLNTGDMVTVYFYEGMAIRTYYGNH